MIIKHLVAAVFLGGDQRLVFQGIEAGIPLPDGQECLKI